MPDEMWALQRSQLGKQAGLVAAGNAAVAATVRLVGMSIEDEPNPMLHEFGPQGEMFNTMQNRGIEYSQHKISGRPDYNEMAWLLAMALGNVAPTTPTGGTLSKKRVYTPPVDDLWGPPMIATLERGANQRGRQYPDLIVKTFDFTTGEDKWEQSGDGFAGRLVPNNALTSSLVGLAEVPILGENTKLYLDTTLAGIGGTQLLRYFEHKWGLADIYAPGFPGGVVVDGFGMYTQKKPKATGQLTVQADSVGEGTILNLMETNAYGYLRLVSTGPVIENEYTVSLGAPASGTFTLTYNGQTTAGIAYNALAATVQTALQGLSSVGSGNATVSGGAGGPYTIYLTGPLLSSTNLLTGSGAGLTGGTFSVTHNLINYLLQIDSAIKFIKQSAYKNVSDLAGNDWPFVISKDPNWTTVNATGQAFQITLINTVGAI